MRDGDRCDEDASLLLLPSSSGSSHNKDHEEEPKNERQQIKKEKFFVSGSLNAGQDKRVVYRQKVRGEDVRDLPAVSQRGRRNSCLFLHHLKPITVTCLCSNHSLTLTCTLIHTFTHDGLTRPPPPFTFSHSLLASCCIQRTTSILRHLFNRSVTKFLPFHSLIHKPFV